MQSLVQHLAREPAFRGIGFAKAARLAEAYGEDLPRLLAGGDPTPFIDIVGNQAAEVLVRVWREDLARGDLIVWLGENGAEPRLADKIIRLWGSEGVKFVRLYPYALIAIAEWRVVDALARRLGVDLDAPERLVAAAEAVLYARLLAQHTWTATDHLKREIRRLLQTSDVIADQAVEAAHRSGAAWALEKGWQPAGAAMMEKYIADRVAKAGQVPLMKDLIAREISDAECEDWFRRSNAETDFTLDKEQRDAVRLALRSRFALLLGGAGVGKTTVLRSVCAACECFGRAVHQVALAGRAAVRMRESTGRPALTIAAFIKACEAGKVALGPESLIVVDEASMVDLSTLYRLMRQLPDSARLLFVGDEGQLGPIGFGLTFHSFVRTPNIPSVRLTKIYRQAASTGIPKVAVAVRQGSLPALPSEISEQDGVYLIDYVDAPAVDDIVDVIAELGGPGERLRILSPVKGGKTGVEAINARLHGIMSVGRERLDRGSFALGEPVIFGRNDYRKDLRNGSLGVITGVAQSILKVDFDGVTHSLSGLEIDDVSLAYAITVHKAQGSQFETVVIPFTATKILDRSMIYTAITRGVKRVVLLGPRSVLRHAITLDSSVRRREVGLAMRLDAS